MTLLAACRYECMLSRHAHAASVLETLVTLTAASIGFARSASAAMQNRRVKVFVAKPIIRGQTIRSSILSAWLHVHIAKAFPDHAKGDLDRDSLTRDVFHAANRIPSLETFQCNRLFESLRAQRCHGAY